MWSMLAANGRTPRPAKFMLDRYGQPHVCADVAVIDASTGRPLSEACAALLAANAQLELGESPANSASAPDACGDFDMLLDTLREAVWPEASIVDGVIEAAFEARGGRRDVRIAQDAAGLRFVVDIGDAPAGASCSREAVARLLLSASAIRGPVRAVAGKKGERERLRFEALIPVRALPGHVADAALGIMLVCDSFGPEVTALSRPALAEAYLAMLNHSVLPRPNEHSLMSEATRLPVGNAWESRKAGVSYDIDPAKRKRATTSARDSLKRFLPGG
jgi:hypothetical protein